DDAKTVAANPSTDENAVAQAINAVDAGLETAKAEVAAIDRQAGDEAAAKAAADAIKALPAEAGLDDKAAVEAARKAYDALTEDQKKLVPEDVLKRLATAEAQVVAAEEAAKVVSITECRITVMDHTYTGKAVKKPVVTVNYGNEKLKEGRDYTLTYNKKALNIGTYKLKVKGIGKYTGTKTLSFKIIPKGTVFTKRTGGNKQITLTWKKQNNITGYQIQYSLKKNFSGGKTVLVNKAATLTKVIKNLKAGKTYYVRIRTYKKVNKKSYISLWSKVMTVKTSGVKGNAPAQVVEVALQAGEALDLNGLFPGSDAWESSDEAVVAVSDGVANALAAGEAVVDGLDAEGEEVSVVITVTESVIGIEGLELGADLSLPGIDELDDGEIVMDDATELTLE
ncbi:MAG: fibronectin type III domain-containing protein, partial [Eubacteriales bacterium]